MIEIGLQLLVGEEEAIALPVGRLVDVEAKPSNGLRADHCGANRVKR